MPITIERYGNGHINDTYLVKVSRFILQKININIFTNPDGLMENIENVPSFLRDKIIASGGNPERETLTVIKTLEGKSYYNHEGDCYRMYKFVEDIPINIPKCYLCHQFHLLR